MAIEIGEMVVRASTGQSQNPVQAKQDSPKASEPQGGTRSGEEMDRVKKAVLAECREMILEILSDREER